MKSYIFHKLGEALDNAIKRDKEFREMPPEFWMDLNESDFYKFEKSIPREEKEIYSMTFISAIWSILKVSFILYVIADFMNYETMIKALENIAVIIFPGIFKLIGLAFLIYLIIALTKRYIVRSDRKKHRLAFYKRMKKYKK